MPHNNQKYGCTLTKIKECITLIHIICFAFFETRIKNI